MNSLFKFNLIFLPLLAIALAAVVFTARELLQANAREQIVQNARIMMETATSSRTYTTKQVAPLLQRKNFKLQEAIGEFQKALEELPKDIDPTLPKDVRLASAKKAYLLGQQHFIDSQQKLLESLKNKPEELLDLEFHPQSVPAFAATEIFKYLNEKYPEYTYKEATLNPTNPLDRASDWEADVVNQFRNDPKLPELMLPRQTATGDALVLARPITIKSTTCLACHTTPDQAPPEMVKLYPARGGYGWKLNEIIGAQVVSVPKAVPVGMADKAWNQLNLWLGGAFLGIAVAGNAGMAIGGRRKD